jgi:Zn-dependent protease with chaperone function/Zn-finger nucleic acid-binding protein
MTFVTVWLIAVVVSMTVFIFVRVPGIAAFAFAPRFVAALLGGALVVSTLYWFVSRIGARGRLLRAMHAKALDPGDSYHHRLADIVEEMRLATGGPPIDCVVVDTLGMNAFAFSDLRGRGCVGVTEGALARLSRPQLEGIVAHEFAHILSGGYVTVTVSCLLFGIYSSAGEKLEGAGIGAGAAARMSPALFAGAGLLRLVLWFAERAAAIVNAALSRQREREADLAAARYTRDPVSLAQALRTISRHPGGAGYIPSGLAPLCIRSADNAAGRMATHPPINERIAALLQMANMGSDEFEQQAKQADDVLAKREHSDGRPDATESERRDAAFKAWATASVGFAPAGATAAATTTSPAATPASAQRVPPAAPPPMGAPPAPPAAPSAAPPPAAPPPAASPAEAIVGFGIAGGMLAPDGTTHANTGSPAATHTNSGTGACPSCGRRLAPLQYEGLELFACACGGRLASSDQVARVLARREMGFTDDQRHLADLVLQQGDQLRRAAILQRGHPLVPLVHCPHCGQTMVRRFYSYDFAVEIDVCTVCDLFWFEKDELEVLQILAERQVGGS